MAVQKNNHEIKLKSFCEKYITIDSNGKIDFKSHLKYALNHNSIYRDDAILIALELMFNLKNNFLNHEKVYDEMHVLVKKVEKYNFEGDETSKRGVLFFHNYDYEKEFLSNYVNNLYIIKKPDKKMDSVKKVNSKSFKNSLSHLSREELCYILDLNPEVNFEREKALKNRIVDKYSSFPIDISKLDNVSCEDIKAYLSSLYGDESDNDFKQEENIAEPKIDNIELSNQNTDISETPEEKRKRLTAIRKKENELFLKQLEEERRKKSIMRKKKKSKSMSYSESTYQNTIKSSESNNIVSQPKNITLEDSDNQKTGYVKTQQDDVNKREIEGNHKSSEKINKTQVRKHPVKTISKLENRDSRILNSYPYDSLEEPHLNVINHIIDAVEEGFKYIIFEAGVGFGKSTISATLANIYENSLILRANEQLQNMFKSKFNNKIANSVSVSNYYQFLKNQDSFKENKLLIIDDAHLVDQMVVDYLDVEKDEFVAKIDDYVDENLFDIAEICIFISSSILNPKQFLKDFGIDLSQVKFIRRSSPFDFKNRIFTKNSFNMKYKFIHESARLSIPVIKEILSNYEDKRGIIFASDVRWKNFIIKQVGGYRLWDCDYNLEEKIKMFKRSSNNVLVCTSVEDYMKLPSELSNFQIIFRQPMPLWDDRAKLRDFSDSNWYNYKKAISIVPMLENNMDLRKDYCDIYMIDGRFPFFIIQDMEGVNFIPEHIRNSIEDMDLIDYGAVSNSIKLKYGIYYMHDYVPDTQTSLPRRYDLKSKELSKKIQDYKDYQFDSTKFKEEFMFFTNELMKGISEFSNHVLGEGIEKLALIAIPSSTLERDKYNSMRSTIDYIEKYYNEGILKSQFGCTKEIINCGTLFERYEDVKTSHLDDRRAYYSEHLNTIKCNIGQIENLNNMAFIILDDIATRGTVMNACEDILIENNVDKDKIYKFAIFKTIGVEYDEV